MPKPIFQSIKAQTTLEFTLCFVVVIILFFAAFKAFIWAGQTFFLRQNAFEDSRVPRDQIDAYGLPASDFYDASPVDLSVQIGNK